MAMACEGEIIEISRLPVTGFTVQAAMALVNSNSNQTLKILIDFIKTPYQKPYIRNLAQFSL